VSNAESPVIIEAAINGAASKALNPNVPRRPNEVAEDGLRCLAAGAAIVHNHNLEPVVGGPSGRHDPAPYREAWGAILGERPDAILYPTMASGGPQTTFTERYAHIVALAQAGMLRVGLVDPGSVNVGPIDSTGLPAAIDMTYINTFADARQMLSVCAAHRLGPSISIFEPGFLRVILLFHAAGKLAPGSLVKFYFGGARAAFGLPPTRPSLEAYLAMLEGTGLPWSVAVLGGDVLASGMAEMAIERGGHVRVGLEDYAGPEKPSNEDLVTAVVELVHRLGRRVASPSEASSILGLPRPAPASPSAPQGGKIAPQHPSGV
jgi:3-keto-5-aminohexanoate cleavage enzyme